MAESLRRWALIVAAVVVVAFLLVLLAAAVTDIDIWIAGVLGVQHSLGIDTQMSKNYDTVSGHLPVIVTALGFSSVIVGAWHHLNCHVPGCPKIGRYPIAGGQYKVCKADRNAITGDELSTDHIQKAHDAHVGRKTRK